MALTGFEPEKLQAEIVLQLLERTDDLENQWRSERAYLHRRIDHLSTVLEGAGELIRDLTQGLELHTDELQLIIGSEVMQGPGGIDLEDGPETPEEPMTTEGELELARERMQKDFDADRGPDPDGPTTGGPALKEPHFPKDHGDVL